MAILSGLTYFVASALLRLATEPFRKRTSQWAEYTLQLLQRVSCLLNEKDPSYLSLEKKKLLFLKTIHYLEISLIWITCKLA